MVYITGDTHGEFYRFSTSYRKDDYMIITGDFGGIWAQPNSKHINSENYWLNWLASKPCTFVICLGNHCFSKRTDILTEEGWKNISDVYNNSKLIKLAQFDFNNSITFDYPTEKIKNTAKKLIKVSGQNTNFEVTDLHDVIIDSKKVKAISLLNQDNIKENRFTLTGFQNNLGIDIEDNWIRLLTWVCMDGTIFDSSKYTKNPSKSIKVRVQFKLSKERKLDELKNLLDEMNITYTFAKATMSGCNKLQPYMIRIYGDFAREINNRLNKIKVLPDNFKNMSQQQLDIFLDTLSKTDGTKKNNQLTWRTTDKKNVDIIQECCIKNNYYFNYQERKNDSGFKNGKLQYNCNIYSTKKTINRCVNVEHIDYNDDVYCFTMPQGTLITRLDGKVSFNGNCNFNRIYSEFDLVDFNGGKAYKIRDNIFIIKNGESITLDNKTFLFVGGAYSIDKSDRIIDVSWWEQEEMSYTEMVDILTEQEGKKYDYIISHTCPKEIIKEFKVPYYDKYDRTSVFLDDLRKVVSFKHWYFGHFHEDKDLTDKFTCLYRTIEIIKEIT